MKLTEMPLLYFDKNTARGHIHIHNVFLLIHSIAERCSSMIKCFFAINVKSQKVINSSIIVGTEIIRTGSIPPSNLPVSDPF